jgi:hypothetical protein
MTRCLALCFLVILCGGCRQPNVTKHGRAGRTAEQSTSRNLTQAIDYLARANEFDQAEAYQQVAFLMNRWLDGRPVDEEWTPDPLTARLPREIRNTAEMQELERTQIRLNDVYALQQAIWLRDLSNWISEGPGDAEIEAWLDEPAVGLEEFEARQLLVATRLFDWTIRNVQLDELLPYPTKAAVGPAAGAEQIARPEDPPPMRGVPGPGYQRLPWQTLLYGHGDAHERARVFILLCRQQGIDAAMLAFPTQSIPPRPRPWLPAVQIADQLYLFDTQLGLPIPGPGGRGVATLEQVRQDPQLLAALGVGSANPYDVGPDDLKAVLALMDVAHYDVSRRMGLIEQHLSGDYRVVLTVAPTKLAQRLERASSLDSVAFWRAPMEACWFRNATQKRLSEDRRAAAEHIVKFAVFESRNALMQARQLHFRGILDSEGENRESAIKYYLSTRIPEAQLDRLDELEDLQRSLGLYRARGENDMMWAAKVATTRNVVGQSKEHASYWLGLTQYELGRFDAACEWFERRTLAANPDGKWAQGARYNLGRSLEAMGKLAEARKHYLSSEDSPQHHGDLVRARMLAQRISAQTSDDQSASVR